MCKCCFCEGNMNGDVRFEREDKFGNTFCCNDCAADYYHQTEYFGVTPELAVKTLFEDFGLHQIKRESK